MVLERIRLATRASHDALERDVKAVERLSQERSRLDLMLAYYAMYAPAEAGLKPHLCDVTDLNFDERCKATILGDDLRALGVRTLPEPSRRDELPFFSNIAHALGFAYVLEGASLGGRVIRRHASAGGAVLDHIRFFDVYGAETGRRWKEFCAVLERECADAPQEAVKGAIAGFRYARAKLIPDTSALAC
jgi:heme oxygenase